MNIDYYHSPVGIILIESDANNLHRVSFVDKASKKVNPSSITEKCKLQLEEYFSGKRKEFDLPLKTEGTDFQKKVWNALSQIPYGKTQSYKQVAEKIGHAKAHRAVGNANNKNKFVIIIPCHRVVSSSGALAGYAYGEDVKKKLIELENLNG